MCSSTRWLFSVLVASPFIPLGDCPVCRAHRSLTNGGGAKSPRRIVGPVSKQANKHCSSHQQPYIRFILAPADQLFRTRTDRKRRKIKRKNVPADKTARCPSRRPLLRGAIANSSALLQRWLRRAFSAYGATPAPRGPSSCRCSTRLWKDTSQALPTDAHHLFGLLFFVFFLSSNCRLSLRISFLLVLLYRSLLDKILLYKHQQRRNPRIQPSPSTKPPQEARPRHGLSAPNTRPWRSSRPQP